MAWRDPATDPPPEGAEVWLVHASGEGRGYLLRGVFMLCVPGPDIEAQGVTGWRELTPDERGF